MKLSMRVAGSAVSVLLLTAAAAAQQPQLYPQGQPLNPQGQPLSDGEVRQFVGGIERDVNQMVQSRDLSRLHQWTQDIIADHAVMSRTNSVETEGHSRVMSSVTITKPDLLRLQQFAFSSMSDKLGNLNDFRLDIQVLNVEPVGDSAAIVKTRVTEHATLTARQGEGNRLGQQRDLTTGQAPQQNQGGGNEGQRRPDGGQQGGVQIQSNATCTHLIERNRDAGRLQIGMGVCDANTQAQL